MRVQPHLVLAASLLIPAVVWAGTVTPGESRGDVIATMGPPLGTVSSQTLEILHFARGEVWLRDGRVSSIALLSEGEHAESLARGAADAEALAAARLERDRRLETEGWVMRDRRLADPRFLALPAREQLRIWQGFAVRYPMVPVGATIGELLDEAAAEDAMTARLAELDARVAEAEARAARAGQEAGRAYSSGAVLFPAYCHRPGRTWGLPHVRPHHTRPHEESARSRVGPPADPMDAARAEVMGRYEAVRRAIYMRAGP